MQAELDSRAARVRELQTAQEKLQVRSLWWARRTQQGPATKVFQAPSMWRYCRDDSVGSAS